MNTKDSNEIARIIEKISVNTKPTGKGFREVLIIELADYFEREDNERAIKITHKYPEAQKRFNRTQFLKDCGIDD